MAAAMATSRPKRMLGQKRRVEDEEGGPDQLDLDDDSLSEGSVASDDNEPDPGVDSDTSNIDETSPVAPNRAKSNKGGNGADKAGASRPAQPAADPAAADPLTDTQRMVQGMSIDDKTAQSEGTGYEEAESAPAEAKSTANRPLVVSSDMSRHPSQAPGDRRRREHDEYKRRRDEDPAFVPNRGAFFMHDHRHPGPSANGFRPFGRGRAKGGRGGIGGPFAPVSQFVPPDPLTSGQWSHDMHEVVADPRPSRQARPLPESEGMPNRAGDIIPTCPRTADPINRTMSTKKTLGNVQVKVYLPVAGIGPVTFSIPAQQYIKLPDHRPPLRRDKPVRISLPGHTPRYIFPAEDRSFIFIPRAMRPNQQRGRGKPRSGMGSIGGFSRRTSVFGGSFYGSTYSPSVDLSRRSSLAPDSRDYMFSPTGSAISRPPLPAENPRPVVRLPPSAHHPQGPHMGLHVPVPPEMAQQQGDMTIGEGPAPQFHLLPHRPTAQEVRPQPIPMHQPKPQKAVSVADIDSASLNQQSFQQAFHQQVPMQVPSGYGQDGHAHSRQPSYPSQHSTGTPLSQIPERAIHAAPFQPTPYQQQAQQQQGYYGQPYGMVPPQQGYYYPPYNGGAVGSSGASAPYMPAPHQPQGPSYPQQPQGEQQQAGQPRGQPGAPNIVPHEVNGMVYYYDASQAPPPAPPVNYQPYQAGAPPAPQGYGSGVPAVGGMVTPSPDGFFYPQQAAPGMAYYPQ